jgi:hypothetical protein
MKIDFKVAKCQTYSNKKIFGLCDEPAPAKTPAYIDENDGAKWIAVVENDYCFSVTFTAIDNCIVINSTNGKLDKRCDGVLTFNSNVIFVELKKQRAKKNDDWIKDAENQLKSTINHFELSDDAATFKVKEAYIANSEHPKFKHSQTSRMEQFYAATGYVLRIKNRITLT